MIVDADVIIKIKMSKVISQDELDAMYAGNLEDCIRYMIQEEGHFVGLMDDDYSILYVGKQS